MTLVTSQIDKEEARPMAEAKTAKDDITVENVNGQTVVVVHAGQPVPDNLDELKAKAAEGQVQASDDEIAAARGGSGK
jgi:hypothetical protein